MDITQVALMNALAKTTAKLAEDLPPNTEVMVDEIVSLRVKARVRRFPNEQNHPTASIPLIPVIEFLCHRAGWAREIALQNLLDASTYALNSNKKAEGAIKSLLPPDVSARMEELVKEFRNNLPLVERKGKLIVDETEVSIIKSMPTAAVRAEVA